MRKQVTKEVWVDCCEYCGKEFPVNYRRGEPLRRHEQLCGMFERGEPPIAKDTVFWHDDFDQIMVVVAVERNEKDRSYTILCKDFDMEEMAPSGERVYTCDISDIVTVFTPGNLQAAHDRFKELQAYVGAFAAGAVREATWDWGDYCCLRADIRLSLGGKPYVLGPQ